jgi:hypothetical protein
MVNIYYNSVIFLIERYITLAFEDYELSGTGAFEADGRIGQRPESGEKNRAGNP